MGVQRGLGLPHVLGVDPFETRFESRVDGAGLEAEHLEPARAPVEAARHEVPVPETLLCALECVGEALLARAQGRERFLQGRDVARDPRNAVDAPPLVPHGSQDRLEDTRATADEVFLLELQRTALGDHAVEVWDELCRARALEAVRDGPSREIGVQEADPGVERGVHRLEGQNTVLADADDVDPVEEVREEAVEAVVRLVRRRQGRSVRTRTVRKEGPGASPLERLPEEPGLREDLEDTGAQHPGDEVRPALRNARHDRRSGHLHLERPHALEASLGGFVRPDEEDVPRPAPQSFPVAPPEGVDVDEVGQGLPFVRGGADDAPRDAGRDARREDPKSGRDARFDHGSGKLLHFQFGPPYWPRKRCG